LQETAASTLCANCAETRRKIMDQEPSSPTHRTFESLQSHSNSMQRTRPEMVIVRDEPLRAESRSERVSRRESRVGLRSIFGRAKAEKEGKDVDAFSSLREPSRSGGIRASLADVSNWPYSLHASRSDMYLSGPPPPSSRSTSALETQPSIPRLRQPRQNKIKPSPTASLAIPLFQAFPQSVKHATLPACSTAVDALQKINGNRNSVLVRDDLAASTLSLNMDEDVEKRGDRAKKLQHRSGGSRNILEWTSKTYVLVTSGYLLQYAAEGSFDRTPERILRLTKDSAAFASDLIPGRHWVLQVSSSMEPDGTPGTESKSYFSKFALRGSGRRSVSNFLMVFESAEDMGAWLATFRREIEALGGKKKLSETGNPKPEDTSVELRAQPSQRTLVVRDPKRFSHIVRHDFSWTNENALKDHDDNSARVPSSELTPELVLDDVSTTESHSSDSHHLESLRDSGNRLSFISSGQRTFVTSTGSSPASSPIRASFSSHPEDLQLACHGQTLSQMHETQPTIRARPNAQEIVMRRQSMQTMSFDSRFESLRPQSTISNLADHNDERQGIPARQSIPNFSKRLSVSRPTPLDAVPHQPQAPEHDFLVKANRKSPPTALAMSRPLSIVVDQPSPISPLAPKDGPMDTNAANNEGLVADAPDSASMFSSWIQSVSTPSPREDSLPSRGTKVTVEQPPPSEVQLPAKDTLRRFVSMSRLGSREEYSAESNTGRFMLSSSIAQPKTQHQSYMNTEEPPRSLSTMGTYGTDRRLSTAPVTILPPNRRASYIAEGSFRTNEWSSCTDERISSLPRKPWRMQSRSPIMSSSQFSTTDSSGKRLMGRKSMPELVEGPPLLPPPNRALPPLPKKHLNTICSSQRGVKT
jgi:hypothetical protein